MSSEVIFKPIADEAETGASTEIESLCVNCEESVSEFTTKIFNYGWFFNKSIKFKVL